MVETLVETMPPAVASEASEPGDSPEAPAAPKKKGRPNMKEAKKQVRKAQMSSLDMFIESKPTKAKVRDYLEARVKQLKEDE